MKFDVHAATDIGRIRQNNEDCYLVDEKTGVFAVADGLGGLDGGEIASRTAIDSISERLEKEGPAALSDLSRLLLDANEAVVQASQRLGILRMATTMTLAHVAGDRLRIAHVGDSFALLVRGGTCVPLTREHNIENDSRDRIDLAAYPPSYRHALTRVIGQTEPLRVDLYEKQLQPGDWIILATDGLTDCVANVAIAAACAGQTEPAVVVPQLVTAALETSGHDNITVVGIHIGNT